VDVVPTFTTSNARICLLLSNGRYGLLRIEDAERLQARGNGGGRAACTLAGLRLVCCWQFVCHAPATTPTLCTTQGLPPGHTAPCFPISMPGIRQHRTSSTARDSDADTAARARFALLGNAVTVQVCVKRLRAQCDIVAAIDTPNHAAPCPCRAALSTSTGGRVGW
jgi:hypothetical protein